LYFYGVRLHILADYQKGNLPIPKYIGLTEAGALDRKVHEQLLPTLNGQHVFADKAYQVANKALLTEEAVNSYTPVKK
jgi:hypothetical protein